MSPLVNCKATVGTHEIGSFRYWKSAKFLGFASPQIHNFFLYVIDPHILDPQIS